MNRSELVRSVAERAESDESAARRYVDAVFDTVMERVSAGERVIVTGFGTFDSFARPARSARNPRTGQPVEVPAAQVPRFRSGQTFRNRVAGSVPAVEPAAEPEAAATVPVEAAAPKKAENGKKAKKNAEPKKPSGKAKAVAPAPAKNGKAAKGAAKAVKDATAAAGTPDAKNGRKAKAAKDVAGVKGAKNGKKKAGKGKARSKAAK